MDTVIHLFEEHSSSLPVWWQLKDTPLPVVYLDAHLDLQQIDRSRLERLHSATSVSEIRALEAPNHLDISEKYSFGIENFLHAASDMNLIKRLIWVAPPHIPRCYSTALFAFSQKIAGASFAEITGFAKVGKSSMRGILLGLDITICHFDDLDNLDIGRDYYLDIDIDYFVNCS